MVEHGADNAKVVSSSLTQTSCKLIFLHCKSVIQTVILVFVRSHTVSIIYILCSKGVSLELMLSGDYLHVILVLKGQLKLCDRSFAVTMCGF